MTRLERQIHQAVKDTAWLIRKAGTSARLLRPVKAGEDSFFGSFESDETEIGTISIEKKLLEEQDLAEIGADAVADVLPDSGVEESDILEIEGIRYRATDVKPQNFFGAVTHIRLHLELEKRETDGA